MADFIDNLVQKAAGLPLRVVPKPPSLPRFEISEEFQKPTEITEDAIELSTGPDKNKPPERSIISPASSRALLAQVALTVPESNNEPADSKAQAPELDSSEQEAPSTSLKSGAQIQKELKPSMITEDTINITVKPDKNKPPERSTISATSSRAPLTQVTPTVPESDKELADFKALAPESDSSEQEAPSTSPKPGAKIQKESLNKADENQEKHGVVEKKLTVFQRTPLFSPPLDRSKRLQAGEENVVAVEPLAETFNQMQVKKLMTRTSNAALAQQATQGVPKNAEVLQNKKEVRINIGRVEIKASQQTASNTKLPVRGFDEYLMARVYLDRCYF